VIVQVNVKGIMSGMEGLDVAAIALATTACNPFVILVLENHPVTTVLFPATITAPCLILIAKILYRRPIQAGWAG
jgi:hypothetical protein